MSRMQDLQEHLKATAVDRSVIAKVFDEANPPERIQLLESIGGRGQARLWEASAGRKLSIQQLVPRELGPLVPVIFHGKNSLPAFTRFQKRFCRPSEDEESGNSGETPRDELWGYNYQPTRWLATLTGPGYFVAYDSGSPSGSVAIDYRRIPRERPAGWPEIHDNRYRLSRFIFNGMVDYLRPVSEHLLIGRATRGSKELDNYFLLCREEGG